MDGDSLPFVALLLSYSVNNMLSCLHRNQRTVG